MVLAKVPPAAGASAASICRVFEPAPENTTLPLPNAPEVASSMVPPLITAWPVNADPAPLRIRSPPPVSAIDPDPDSDPPRVLAPEIATDPLSISLPPKSTDSPLAKPPAETVSVPPLDTVVLLAVPPENTVWAPPFNTTVPTAVPP